MNITTNSKWKQSGITVAGNDIPGNGLKHLFWPQNIYIDDDDDQTLYITDHGNNRIVKWAKDADCGEVIAGGNRNEHGTVQLNQPTDIIVNKSDNSLIICDWGNRRVVRQNNSKLEVILSNIDCWGATMDNDGVLYTSDCKKNEVRQWTKQDLYGRVVAGGIGHGISYSELNWPTFIFIDEDYSLYIADNSNHRVMKWIKGARQGIVVAGNHGRGNKLTQLSNPHGIFVDYLKNVYVADFGNHRIVCWSPEAKEGKIILGGNGEGRQANQFNGPIALSFDRDGNCYVVDHRNHRVQKFLIDSN